MKKLLKVVNVELRPTGDFVTLCFDDYTPETEQVDPVRERLERAKKQLEEIGAPKDVAAIFDILGGLGNEAPGGLLHPSGHRETAKVLVTAKEYEEMGRPTVGQLIAVVMERSKEEPALQETRPQPRKYKPVGLPNLIETMKQLEGLERKPVDREKLKQMLSMLFDKNGDAGAEALISHAFREGMIYESKPGFIRRLGA